MGKTATILFKIARLLLIAIFVLCIIAEVGTVGAIEKSSDKSLGELTMTAIKYGVGALISILLAKLTDKIIKVWGYSYGSSRKVYK